VRAISPPVYIHLGVPSNNHIGEHLCYTVRCGVEHQATPDRLAKFVDNHAHIIHQEHRLVTAGEWPYPWAPRGFWEREYVHTMAGGAREERVPSCSGNEDGVVNPSERLDPLDGGDVARLHIQLVAVLQREVHAQQLLADGDGDGA